MAAWKKWFEQAADRTVDNIGLRAAREISHGGTRDLPMGPESITGCTIINAGSLDEAEALASTNPFISSIRICEIAGH